MAKEKLNQAQLDAKVKQDEIKKRIESTEADNAKLEDVAEKRYAVKDPTDHDKLVKDRLAETDIANAKLSDPPDDKEKE